MVPFDFLSPSRPHVHAVRSGLTKRQVRQMKGSIMAEYECEWLKMERDGADKLETDIEDAIKKLAQTSKDSPGIANRLEVLAVKHNIPELTALSNEVFEVLDLLMEAINVSDKYV